MKEKLFPESEPLTPVEEKVIMPDVLDTLLKCQDKKSSIKSREIVNRLKPKHPSISDVMVRKIIHYARHRIEITNSSGQLMVIIGCAVGFYITRKVEEIEAQVESLDSRENAIRRVKDAVKLCLHKIKLGL